MLTVDRYLLREFAASVAATTTVLLFVAVGVLVADLLNLVVEGKVPVSLMFSQLGLRMLRWMPLILPLGVFLGLLLSIGRLYRDSEMAVLTSIGRSPRDMLRPLSLIAVPAAVFVAICSLWAGPWAQRTSSSMIADANRSLVIAGLEAGRFRDLPSGKGILYVTDLSPDGSKMKNVFIESEKRGKMSLITAKHGELFIDGHDRYMRLFDGMRVEGVPGQKAYHVLHYERSEVRMAPDDSSNDDDVTTKSTTELIASRDKDARAELHWRIATPLAVLLLALLTIPLARAEPRQPRYDLLLLALAVYVLYMALLLIGRAKLGLGKMPAELGLWWLHVPMLLLGLWLLRRDGELRKPRAVRG